MPLVIPDETLQAAKMSEREAKIEIACRLFAAEKLAKHDASKLAGLTRAEFEGELIKRDLPILIYAVEMWERDLRALAEMKEQDLADRQ